MLHRGACLGVVLALLTLAALSGACDLRPVGIASADEDVLEAARRSRLERSAALPEGQCLHHGDCADGMHCEATAPRVAVCVDGAPPPGEALPADGALPPPPTGLLDGSMLRRHAGAR